MSGRDFPDPIEPGIYFGFDEDKYHAAPWLGSGDHKRLRESPPDFWWNSWMNPLREADKETDARILGSAIHAYVLQGREIFDKQYARSRADDPDVLKTVAEIKNWIIAHPEFDMSTKIPGRKDGAIALAQALDPEVEVLEFIEQQEQERGRKILPAKGYDRCLIAGSMIAKNPGLETAWQGGYPEVAIFWRDAAGTPCKCLLDYLKPRGIGDLKSVGNPSGRDFPGACRIAFADYRYDMQAAHYLDGRRQLPGFVKEGRVFGEVDPDWLKRTAKVDDCGFAFVFYQTTGAPLTHAEVLSPANPIIEIADQHVQEARAAYRDFSQRFGESMWLLANEVSELDISELPNWYGR